MALKDTDINALINHYTQLVINTATYEQLRESLLQKKSSKLVVEHIEQALAQYCFEDKEAFQDQVTEQACKQQVASDKEEALKDASDNQKDLLLRTEYEQRLPTLEARLSELNPQIIVQDKRCAVHKLQDKELQSRKKQFDSELASITKQKTSLKTQYEVQSIMLYKDHHAHQHQHQHHHEGHHGHQHQHNSAPTVTVHSHHDEYSDDFSSRERIYKSEWDSLESKERLFLAEKLRIEGEISKNRISWDIESGPLNDLVREQGSIEGQCKTTRYELTEKLPLKASQRQAREAARNIRAQARQAEDSELNQLSTQSKQALQKNIKSKHQELDALKVKLMQQVVSSCHGVFMSYLESSVLEPDRLQIANPQKQALQIILNLLKESSRAEAMVNDLSTKFQQENNELGRQRANLGDRADLASRQQALAAYCATASKVRNGAALSGGAAITSALVVGVLIAVLALNPLFWCIPGGLVLLGG